jgi:two-component system, OmpR family, sensor kinase
LSAEVWSLHQRLRNRLWLTLTALWMLGSALALFVQWRVTNQLLDQAQEETAQLALNLPVREQALKPAARPGSDLVRIQVFDRQGQLIWRSSHAPEQAMAPPEQDAVLMSEGRRIVVLRDARTGRSAIVSASLLDREEALTNATEGMLAALLLLLPLTAWGTTLLLRQAFVHMQSVQEALSNRDPDALQPLEVAPLAKEFKPLVREINHLFNRLSRAREAERTFVANSAHELRTPVAAAQAQLQRLADELRQLPSGEALRHRTDAIGRQLDRLGRLCVKLMQLARAESGVTSPRQPVDIVTITRLVLDEFGKASQAGRLTLTVAPSSTPIMALGDVDALAIVLRNLIENALNHTPDTGAVTVHVSAGGVVSVTDQGPGLSAQRLETLFQPFERGDSTSPGHGLGLAIVKALCKQMGWHLHLQSPHALGPGVCASVDLLPQRPQA